PGPRRGRPRVIDLQPLRPRHGETILAGQDELLAREIIGRRWDRPGPEAVLERVQNWRTAGPLREYAALSGTSHGQGALIGGVGLAVRGAGIRRGPAALTYRGLEAVRGRGHGHGIAAALLQHARAEPRSGGLVLGIDPGNHASQAVARALGARSTGRSEPHPCARRRTVGRWSLVLDA